MREFIQIVERWHGTFNRDQGDGLYDMHLNPSKAEFFKMLVATPYGQMRGLVTATDLYTWDAEADIHMYAVEHLGMEYDDVAGRILMDREGPFINDCDPISDPEQRAADPLVQKGYDLVMAFAVDHPILRRIYGAGYTLGER